MSMQFHFLIFQMTTPAVKKNPQRLCTMKIIYCYQLKISPPMDMLGVIKFNSLLIVEMSGSTKQGDVKSH